MPPAAGVQPAIFISHSSKDALWVEWLAKQIRLLGVRPYLAEHDPHAGLNLAAKVQREIAASSAMVVLLTSNSASAPYVHQEIGYALAHSKLVIPLVQEQMGEAALAMLQGLEYIPFDFQRPQLGAARLLQEIQGLLQRWRQQQARDEMIVVLAVAALLVVAIASSQPSN
jgi:hypothetical protein